MRGRRPHAGSPAGSASGHVLRACTPSTRAGVRQPGGARALRRHARHQLHLCRPGRQRLVPERVRRGLLHLHSARRRAGPGRQQVQHQVRGAAGRYGPLWALPGRPLSGALWAALTPVLPALCLRNPAGTTGPTGWVALRSSSWPAPRGWRACRRCRHRRHLHRRPLFPHRPARCPLARPRPRRRCPPAPSLRTSLSPTTPPPPARASSTRWVGASGATRRVDSSGAALAYGGSASNTAALPPTLSADHQPALLLQQGHQPL